jgi:hypothetical protein
MRKGEELKAPRHASAAATRDGNLPSRDGTFAILDGNLPYSQYWQLFFYGCYLYINTT